MKKLFIAFIILACLIIPVFADDMMGVKMINSGGQATSKVSLDDLQLNTEIPIEGYAIIKATSFEFFDWLGYYGEGQVWVDARRRYTTGNEADFAMLRLDITNRMTESKNFLENVKVKVIYENYYEFEGWCYQFNYDNHSSDWSDQFFSSNIDKNNQPRKWVISKKDQFAINPMYAGHYVFGCTLPNAVINGNAPLRMEITIDDNTITYNIRK